jgi:RNA-directed DNA polymerase
MKRHGYLYEQIYDRENLQVALTNAAKGKRGIRSVERVLADPDKYLTELQDILATERFVNGPYHVFNINERGKDRTIHSLPFFPDRIVHHAIVQVCAPIWIRSMVRDTYASIPGRGIHDGVRRLQRIVPQCDGHYSLKCDITKFYPSVDHDILKGILRSQIKDPKLLRLLDTIIDSGPGVPIGNYLSQYFGNIILNPFDHWLKDEKKVRLYFRYCDDFVIIHESKQYLHGLRQEIESTLKGYGFILKLNWQVSPISDRGIDFLGYRFWPYKTKLRKTTLKNFEHRLKCRRMTLNEAMRLRDAIGTYKGWLKYCGNRGFKRTRVLPVRARYNKYIRRLRRNLLKAV